MRYPRFGSEKRFDRRVRIDNMRQSEDRGCTNLPFCQTMVSIVLPKMADGKSQMRGGLKWPGLKVRVVMTV